MRFDKDSYHYIADILTVVSFDNLTIVSLDILSAGSI